MPVAACVYAQDMFVTDELSRATAEVVPNVRLVVDREHHHDGLRKHGRSVLDGLRAALDDGSAT